MSDFKEPTTTGLVAVPEDRSAKIELRLLHECGRLIELVQCGHTDDLVQAAEIYRNLALVVDHAYLRIYLYSKFQPSVIVTVYESITSVDPKGSILGDAFCGEWDPVDEYLAESYGLRPWRALN